MPEAPVLFLGITLWMDPDTLGMIGRIFANRKKAWGFDFFSYPHTPIFSHIFMEKASKKPNIPGKNPSKTVYSHFPHRGISHIVDGFFQQKSGFVQKNPPGITRFSTEYGGGSGRTIRLFPLKKGCCGRRTCSSLENNIGRKRISLCFALPPAARRSIFPAAWAFRFCRWGSSVRGQR